MLPRTEFEMSENIRDFTLRFPTAVSSAAERSTSIPPPAERCALSPLTRRLKVKASGRVIVEALERRSH